MANTNEDDLMRFKPESTKGKLGLEYLEAYFKKNPLMSPRDVTIDDMSSVIIIVLVSCFPILNFLLSQDLNIYFELFQFLAQELGVATNSLSKDLFASSIRRGIVNSEMVFAKKGLGKKQRTIN